MSLEFWAAFGTGDDHYPLLRQSLKYDTAVEGYRTGITKKQLEGALRYSNDKWELAILPEPRAVNDYYGVAI